MFTIPGRLGYVVTGIEEGAVEGLNVFLRPLPGGPTRSIVGVTAVIWCAAADGEPDVPAAVLGAFDDPPAEARAQIITCLDDLVAEGLLIAVQG